MIFILVFSLKEGRTGNFLKKLFVSDGMILTAFEVFLLVDSSTFLLVCYISCYRASGPLPVWDEFTCARGQPPEVPLLT